MSVPERWFVFDLGNVIVQLDYQRVLRNLCADATLSEAQMMELLESPGGYRDLERGAVTFAELHQHLRERAGYRGGNGRLREVWADFFSGPVAGIERVLRAVRGEYRVAFLSNSNEVHAEAIPRQFASLFRPDDRFIFSHQQRCAKPDRMIFVRALELLDAEPVQCVYVDDLPENIAAAEAVGMTAILFTGSEALERRLREDALLSP